MASIINGYEYDIFISYRRNDNRSGRVTEFVNALQEELACINNPTFSLRQDHLLHSPSDFRSGRPPVQ
jgi:hypothetical protein